MGKVIGFNVNLFVEVPDDFEISQTEFLSWIDNLRVIRGNDGKFTDDTKTIKQEIVSVLAVSQSDIARIIR
jgi:hypothetical protein